MSEHPMDHIPIRKLRFDFDEVEGGNPLWSRTNPDFSMFINAFGVHVPYFERFLINVMRRYRDEIDSERIKEDVRGIIGQEAHHSINFLAWNKVLNDRYPGLAKIEGQAKQFFESTFSEKSKKFTIGFTAGYETFTFLGGMIILDRYDEYMADADPTIRALWVWHQVEEVEHGAVAFEFYKAFYPDDEWYRRFMVAFAFVHLGVESAKAYHHMMRIEGYYQQPRKALDAWKFGVSFLWDTGCAALPVMSKKYHPREYLESNPLANAWRKFYAMGNDPHALHALDVDNMLAADNN